MAKLRFTDRMKISKKKLVLIILSIIVTIMMVWAFTGKFFPSFGKFINRTIGIGKK